MEEKLVSADWSAVTICECHWDFLVLIVRADGSAASIDDGRFDLSESTWRQTLLGEHFVSNTPQEKSQILSHEQKNDNWITS